MSENNRHLLPPDTAWVLLDRVGERAEREFGIPAATAERALFDPLCAGRLALRELLKPTGPGYGYGAGKWGRGAWGTPRGRIPRGFTPSEIGALRFEPAPLRALRCVPNESREVSWVAVENPIEIAWFDAQSFLATTVQPKPSSDRSARVHPRYDDTVRLERMHELISAGRVRSRRAAATSVARELADKLPAASEDALADRLRRQYPKWLHGREDKK
jgi:hypothetical protein